MTPENEKQKLDKGAKKIDIIMTRNEISLYVITFRFSYYVNDEDNY